MKKNITVVMPVKIRNLQEAEWFKIALDSIPLGTPTVIVDDHSSVDWTSVEKISGVVKNNVHHLSDKHGLAAARNRAMAYVKTEFFFSLDADDFLAPNALEIALKKYPGDGFLYGSTVLFNDKTTSTYKARPYDVCKLLEAVYWPNGCLQRTENCEKAGGWDDTLELYEDWDYWLRSFKAGIYGHPVDDVLYHYRQNPNGIIHTLRKNPEMSTLARSIIQEKHKELFMGDDPMCNCGNKISNPFKNTGKSKTSSPVTDEVIHLAVSAGMTILTYVGLNMTQSYYGSVTGTLYRFGTGKNKYGYVAEADAAGFLGLKEHGKHIFTLQETIK
jgi:glycosyltransferase involved in cell wall biosynthesis